MNDENKKNDEFWNAVVNDDIDHVKKMLETDQSLAGRNFDPGSLHSHSFPLVQACKNGNLELMKVLIDAGADPNADTHADPNARLKSEERLMFGMPLIHAMDAGRMDIINFLLDKGASVDAHPNCDRDFATRVYADATAAGAPSEMIMQGFVFLDNEQKTASQLNTNSNTPEMVKLFQRILTLGAKPRMMEMIRNQHYDAIEAVLRNDPGAESSPGDWIGATKHEAILYSAAWYGDPKTMELCFDVCGDRHTTYAAAHCIFKAIESHNRDGNFADYRRIIKMNLEYLKKHDTMQKALNEYDWFNPLFSLSTSFFHNNNYGHRCTVPNTIDDLLNLAKLFIEYGCDVNERLSESDATPLSTAIEKGHEPYVEFLKKHGAN